LPSILERAKTAEAEKPQGFMCDFADEPNWVIATNNPVKYIDPSGLYTLKEGVPPPSPALDAMLRCIEGRLLSSDFVVTSTDEDIPQHRPGTPHREGRALDLRYPDNPTAVLRAAKCCGASYIRDELLHPSSASTAAHIHLGLDALHGSHGPDYPNNQCDCPTKKRG